MSLGPCVFVCLGGGVCAQVSRSIAVCVPFLWKDPSTTGAKEPVTVRNDNKYNGKA